MPAAVAVAGAADDATLRYDFFAALLLLCFFLLSFRHDI